jgi:hypothetical protein
VLALTPAPLETAGERAFFAELTRWDTGGAVRAAVVASLPRFDDGPTRRRIADAVLFVPEGLAVVRVVEVERQSGTVTASPEGAWTIGPAGRPGEVLQLAGGGSSPLDGLMRAGMDTAVRLRRAGLEPGRIARLTVLVGGVTGLVPEDGDLGDGDQVASLDPRSLLLGIARAGRYAGLDNPRLWTTADVRAALEALELSGRGASVEELNGEAFPYSPYVLRRPQLLAPAGLAAAASAAPPAAAAAPAAPAPVAAVLPPSSPAQWGPARPVAVPATAAPLAGRRDTVAVDVPSAPAPDDTGGIGGLFANGEPDTLAPAAPPRPAPSAVPAWAPPPAVPVPPPVPPPAGRVVPPMPPLALPRTAGFPAAASAGAPPPAPTPAVQGSPAPPGVDDGARRGRRALVLVLAAVAVVAVSVLAGLAVLGGGDGSGTASSSAASSAAAEQQPAGPQPGDSVDLEGRTYTVQAVDLTHSCLDHAYGRVAQFFAAADCTGLSRALWATQLDGRAVVVSVSRIRMAGTAAARDLQALTDTSGTGNVNDLLREGIRYTGGPAELSGAEYASAVSGPVVTVVEASCVQPGAGDAGEVDAVAGAALVLETPPFPEG